jgi:hypothetical protein
MPGQNPKGFEALIGKQAAKIFADFWVVQIHAASPDSDN